MGGMKVLKPCPFCGGKAEIEVNPATLNAKALCKQCNVIMKRNFKGNKRIEEILKKMMEESWNQRVKEE